MFATWPRRHSRSRPAVSTPSLRSPEGSRSRACSTAFAMAAALRFQTASSRLRASEGASPSNRTMRRVARSGAGCETPRTDTRVVPRVRAQRAKEQRERYTRRCDSILGEHLVGVTVKPPFARLRRGDDRMTGGLRVSCGVAVRRGIAAQRHTARLTGAKVDPGAPGRDTRLAHTRARSLHRRNSSNVSADSSHLKTSGATAR
jgi:hypothetical protein